MEIYSRQGETGSQGTALRLTLAAASVRGQRRHRDQTHGEPPFCVRQDAWTQMKYTRWPGGDLETPQDGGREHDSTLTPNKARPHEKEELRTVALCRSTNQEFPRAAWCKGARSVQPVKGAVSVSVLLLSYISALSGFPIWLCSL